MVRSVLDIAHARGYLDRNPHEWAILQPERRPNVDPFSFEDQEPFLKCLPEREKGFRKSCPNFGRTYLIVAFDAGLRPSEQLALRWERDSDRPDRSSFMDIEPRKVIIRQGIVQAEETVLKTRASHRAVDMLPTVEAMLRDQMAGTKMLGEYVFCSASGGADRGVEKIPTSWVPEFVRGDLPASVRRGTF